MSERRQKKVKKVVYRARHKSLNHLTAEDTRHAFEERLQGALQRKASDPTYFGVWCLSGHEASFEKVDSNNYRGAAKRRNTTRKLLENKGRTMQNDRTVDQISSREYPMERQYSGPLAQFASSSIQCHPNPLALPDAPHGFPTVSTYHLSPMTISRHLLPCPIPGTIDSLPTLRPINPLMSYWDPEELGICGPGIAPCTINQRFDQGFASTQMPLPQPVLDWNYTCRNLEESVVVDF